MLNDLRVAGRQFLRSPGFAAIAVLSLGLAIGANTTIFDSPCASYAAIPASRLRLC